MKEVDIKLKLTKDHEVFLKNVTPIEALILVSLHHKLAGGNPIEYDKDKIRDVKVVVKPPTAAVMESVPGTPKVVDTTGKVVKEATSDSLKIVTPAFAGEFRDRTDDEEIDRLRGKYSGDKIDIVLQKIRDLPKDFETAIQKGVNLSLPSNRLSEAKL